MEQREITNVNVNLLTNVPKKQAVQEFTFFAKPVILHVRYNLFNLYSNSIQTLAVALTPTNVTVEY